VEDAPPVGRQLERAGIAHLALTQEEVVVDDLYVGRAPGQHQEAERDAADDELAAPDRGLAREQRARRVLHAAAAMAAAHRALLGAGAGPRDGAGLAGTSGGGATMAGMTVPSGRTYCVMAGVV